jgi:excisionase family DNA binding protein
MQTFSTPPNGNPAQRSTFFASLEIRIALLNPGSSCSLSLWASLPDSVSMALSITEVVRSVRRRRMTAAAIAGKNVTEIARSEEHSIPAVRIAPRSSQKLLEQRYSREDQEADGFRLVSNSSVDKRLLKPREAALYLGLKVDTVYRKARLRELPSVKVGRCLRFDRNALDRLIEQHTIETID